MELLDRLPRLLIGLCEFKDLGWSFEEIKLLALSPTPTFATFGGIFDWEVWDVVMGAILFSPCETIPIDELVNPLIGGGP